MVGVRKDVKMLEELWRVISNRLLVGREPDIILRDDEMQIHFDIDLTDENLKALQELAQSLTVLSGVTQTVFPKGFYKECLIMKNL
jgi:hypothetical protein